MTLSQDLTVQFPSPIGLSEVQWMDQEIGEAAVNMGNFISCLRHALRPHPRPAPRHPSLRPRLAGAA
ncbi:MULTISPECIES: hypothetical protein [Cupriavidus]|uniref:Uncharacterized protein n=2 Tax=Cupriavidus TaxID=106589 RepID=A0A375DAZ1_9BURK|nr:MULTISPECIES: hypothetical protein [Cupriavidus]MCO4865695.1 hypothetical protein [Cupriavidus sp. WGlv3]MCO4893437.1 hypothetical protein [Cupriavidus sp. WGtm5]SOY76856.1 hypothetical protein CBM2588_P70037 [Cupriavidus taiwanensis]SOY76911.1 hypothetical protein CBM2592_P80036 [Cupriavidus taiwanensis]SOY76952.1 hypothetical protein CBM2585_P70017 [Cupriavidus taiwanensis]